MYKIYIVDENEVQRRTYKNQLNRLLRGADVNVVSLAPFVSKSEYIPVLAEEGVVGLILDQKLEDGGFNYSGSDLATFVRGIYSKLPIFILTNYKEERELFADSEKDVEYIYAKSEVTDVASKDAQIFKARLLRRLNVFLDVRNERQERFHQLLVKSLDESLSIEETREMELLNEDRLGPIQVEEIAEIPSLDESLEKLRRFLNE